MAKRVLPPPAQISSLNNKSDFNKMSFFRSCNIKTYLDSARHCSTGLYSPVFFFFKKRNFSCNAYVWGFFSGDECVKLRFHWAVFGADEIVLTLEVKSTNSRKSFLLVLANAARRNRIFGRGEIRRPETMLVSCKPCVWLL